MIPDFKDGDNIYTPTLDSLLTETVLKYNAHCNGNDIRFPKIHEEYPAVLASVPIQRILSIVEQMLELGYVRPTDIITGMIHGTLAVAEAMLTIQMNKPHSIESVRGVMLLTKSEIAVLLDLMVQLIYVLFITIENDNAIESIFETSLKHSKAFRLMVDFSLGEFDGEEDDDEDDDD